MQALAPYREQIDRLDTELVRLLGERFGVVRAVAEIKAQSDIPPLLPDRVEAVKARVAELGATQGLQPDFLRTLWQQIIDEACRVEEELIAADEWPAPPASGPAPS